MVGSDKHTSLLQRQFNYICKIFILRAQKIYYKSSSKFCLTFFALGLGYLVVKLA